MSTQPPDRINALERIAFISPIINCLCTSVLEALKLRRVSKPWCDAIENWCGAFFYRIAQGILQGSVKNPSNTLFQRLCKAQLHKVKHSVPRSPQDLLNKAALRLIWVIDNIAKVQFATSHNSTDTKFFFERYAPLTSGLFREAVRTGTNELVSLMLNHGVSVTVLDDFHSALRLAVSSGNAEVVETLLFHGAPIDGSEKHDSALIALCRDTANPHRVEMAELLLKRGASLTKTDVYGKTAFAVALAGGNTPLVELLLKQPQIDRHTKTEDNETAMTLAIRNPAASVGILRLLVARGFDVNEASPYSESAEKGGVTPCQVAVLLKNHAALKYLISVGADVNARGENPRFPIALLTAINMSNAIERSDAPNMVDIIEVLVKAGATTQFDPPIPVAGRSSPTRVSTAREFAKTQGKHSAAEIIAKLTES